MTALLLLDAGCVGNDGNIEKKYNAAIKQCQDQIPLVKQLDQLFPGNYETISGFSASLGNQKLIMRTSLYGRYELMLQLDIKLNEDRTKLLGYGRPEFVLNEFASVGWHPGGAQGQITYNRNSHRKFGKKEWNLLVESKGNLSVLGIEVIKDKPIPGLAEYWKSQAP